MNKTKIIGITLLLCATIALFSQSADKPEKAEQQSYVEKVTSWYMDNMNYGTVTLLMAVESSCFIPFPSEVVVPPAAYKTFQEDSNMHIILVVVFATIGALFGALINYFFALWLGRPIVYKFAGSRLGRICLLSPEKIQKAENYFVKYGNSTTFICRFIPGIRQVISVPAGLARMPLFPFILYTTLGASIWNVILAVMGYIAHGQASLINRYSKEISYIMIFLGCLFVFYLLYNGFVKKKAKQEADKNG
jgi:membrane protein DedA with SNARE-associated domain